jgi:hypothetical protein
MDTLLLAVLLCQPPVGPGPPDPVVLQSTEPRLPDAVTPGSQTSSRFWRLVERLRDLQGVVYQHWGLTLDSSRDEVTNHDIAVNGDVRIDLSVGPTSSDAYLTASIAHDLQHAIQLAQSGSAMLADRDCCRDARPHTSTRFQETRDAIAVGEQVRKEVEMRQPRARTHAPRDEEAWPGVYIGNARTREVVRKALKGAYEWLAKPSCRDVLSDFHDERGRPLAAALTSLQLDLQSYLRFILFRDGFADQRCGDSEILALTVPRTRLVYICGRNLDRELHYNEPWTRAVLIHEALHTLGLGENPPSSTSITAAIVERCGR